MTLIMCEEFGATSATSFFFFFYKFVFVNYVALLPADEQMHQTEEKTLECSSQVDLVCVCVCVLI